MPIRYLQRELDALRDPFRAIAGALGQSSRKSLKTTSLPQVLATAEIFSKLLILRKFFDL